MKKLLLLLTLLACCVAGASAQTNDTGSENEMKMTINDTEVRVELAIGGFLYFHTNFEIICSSFLINTVGSLIVIALNL